MKRNHVLFQYRLITTHNSFINVNHSTHLSVFLRLTNGVRRGAGSVRGRSLCRWPREAQLHERSHRTCIRVFQPRFPPLRAPLTEHPRGEARERTAGPRRCGGEPGQERTPESGLMLAARPPFKHGCCCRCCIHKGSLFIREQVGRVNVPYFHIQSRSADVNRTNGPREPKRDRRGSIPPYLRLSSA